jgi:hypothetical protein
VPHQDFIADHLASAERGFFVFGSRSHVREAAVEEFNNHPLTIARFIVQKKLRNRKQAIRNPFSQPDIFTGKDFQNIEQLGNTALGGNFGVWKDDFMRANGFDESFKCWWPEDSEISARLLNLRLRIKKYRRKCLVYHLDHQQSPRGEETAAGYIKAWEHLTGGVTFASKGNAKRRSISDSVVKRGGIGAA